MVWLLFGYAFATTARFRLIAFRRGTVMCNTQSMTMAFPNASLTFKVYIKNHDMVTFDRWDKRCYDS